MRESFNANEPVLPNAITPIAVVPATGPFLRRSPRNEAKSKPDTSVTAAMSQM